MPGFLTQQHTTTPRLSVGQSVFGQGTHPRDSAPENNGGLAQALGLHLKVLIGRLCRSPGFFLGSG